MNGPTGLDYAAVVALFELRGTRRARRSQVFDDLRVMEATLLNKFREKK